MLQAKPHIISPPRSLAARSSLPPEGAAAPAVWRSQSRGPCWCEEGVLLCEELPVDVRLRSMRFIFNMKMAYSPSRTCASSYQNYSDPSVTVTGT